jgi:hypothetical protein
MVKVKGQISEMAMCIVDDDERILGLAQDQEISASIWFQSLFHQ